MESLNIKFNHREESISLAMGLSEGEGRAIHDSIIDIAENTQTITETLEKLIAEFDGARLVYAIWQYGTLIGQMNNPLARLAGLFGGE